MLEAQIKLYYILTSVNIRRNFSTRANHRFAPESLCQCAAGGIIGSSIALWRELVDLAPYLGITLEESGHLPDSEAQLLYRVCEESVGPYSREVCAWLTLHQCAELSMRYGTAIVIEQGASL
jgi:hypothetical protein